MAYLVLRRKTNEVIIIGDGNGFPIEITILAVEADKVKLGFSAPPEIVILRKEVHERMMNDER